LSDSEDTNHSGKNNTAEASGFDTAPPSCPVSVSDFHVRFTSNGSPDQHLSGRSREQRLDEESLFLFHIKATSAPKWDALGGRGSEVENFGRRGFVDVQQKWKKKHSIVRKLVDWVIE